VLGATPILRGTTRPAAPAFLAAVVACSAFSQTVLLQEGDPCQYFKGFVAPPPDWTEVDFEAEIPPWYEGFTGIGYGDDDDATVLDDMADSYLSVFVRIPFEIPAGVDMTVGLLKVRYDDGFVAYLDGIEIARRGLTGTPPAFNDPAEPHEIANAVGFDESIVVEQFGAIAGGPGPHVLAVEVHNATLDSSDLSFAAELLCAPFVVSSIEPSSGPLRGGGQVTIAGAGFDPADTPVVVFGDVEAPEVTVVDTRTLRVVVPPANDPGVVALTVQDDRGSFTFPEAYRYIGGASVGLVFDGGDRAQAAPIGQLYSEGTIEVWFRKTGGFFWSRLLTVEDSGGTEIFRVDLRGSNRIRARSFIGENWQNLGARRDFGTDWHHFAFVFSPSGRQVFLDGDLLASDSTAMTWPGGARLIVASGQGFTSGFVGEIQSLRLWSTARTWRQLKQFAFAELTEEEGLQAAWPLDEAGGQTARDLGPFSIPLVLGEGTQVDDADPQWAALPEFPEVAVTLVDPNRGPLQGGQSVHIYGTGFSGPAAPEVFFGSQAASSVAVESAWELVVEVPPGSAYGSVDVRVETSRGTAVLPEGYEYEIAEARTLIEEGDLWYYYVATEPPPSLWNQPDFDPEEAGWLQGPTGIGYGDNDDATMVDYMMNQAVTLYAYLAWDFPGDPSSLLYLRARIRYDDGYVLYLNGVEVARANVAGSPPAYDEVTPTTHEITGGTGQFDEEIDLLPQRSLLKAGTNVLACEVHNAALDSSDLSFSLELVAGPVEPVNTVQFIRSDTNRDNLVTVSDAILIVHALFLGKPLPCLEAADVDNNGILNVADALSILQFLFGGGPPPEAPYPEPGPDQDTDSLDCKE